MLSESCPPTYSAPARAVLRPTSPGGATPSAHCCRPAWASARTHPRRPACPTWAWCARSFRFSGSALLMTAGPAQNNPRHCACAAFDSAHRRRSDAAATNRTRPQEQFVKTYTTPTTRVDDNASRTHPPQEPTPVRFPRLARIL